MEEKKENADGLFKVRTYGACLSEGIKLPTRNVSVLLRHLWPSMACVVALATLVGLISGPAFGYLSAPEVLGSVSLSGRMGMCMLGVLLLLIVPGSLYLAQLVALVRRYGQLGYLPLPASAWWPCGREVAGVWGRSVLFLLGGWLLWGVVGTAVFELAGAAWLRLAAGVLILLLVSVPYAMFGLFFLFDDTASFSVSAVFRQSGRHWGALVAVLLLGGVLAGVVAGIGSLPARIMLLVSILSDEAVAQGDLSDVPALFPLMQAFSYALSAFVSCLSLWLLVFPLAFLFGAIRQERHENDEYAAERERADGAD